MAKLAALRQLRIDLDQARIAYERDQRAGSALATVAVIRFLAVLDPTDSAGHQVMFERIAEAFADWSGGRVPELFRPSKRAGKPPDPFSLRMVQATAAAAMDLLMRKGLERQAAAQEVEKVLNRYGVPMGRVSTPGWKVVHGWRSGFLKNRRGPADTQLFTNSRSELSSLVELVSTELGATPEQVRTGILRALADALRRRGYAAAGGGT